MTRTQDAVGLEVAVDWLEARGLDERWHWMRLWPHGVSIRGLPDWSGRVALLDLARDGSVIDVRSRRLVEDDSPKYLGRPGYGLPWGLADCYEAPRRRQALHLTEGEIDAMTLRVAGQISVGLRGATATPVDQLVWLSQFPRVVAWGDGDDAGRRFLQGVQQTIPHARLVECPPGHDVSSVYSEGGLDALRDLR